MRRFDITAFKAVTVGALLIGLVRSFGSIGFPLFTDGLMFLFMTVILITKPSGLFGKAL